MFERSLLSRVLCRLATLEPLVVATISPALLFPTPERLKVLWAVPVIWVAAAVRTGELLPRTPLTLPVAGLALAAAAGAFWTDDLLFSMNKLSGLALGLLWFVASTRWITTLTRIRLALTCMCLGGAVLALVGLWGVDAVGKVASLEAWLTHLPFRIRGLPGAESGFNPNPIAGTLALFVPLQILTTWVALRDRFQIGASLPTAGPVILLPWWAQVGLTGLTAATLLLLQSRSAMLGMAAAALWLVLRHGRRSRWLVGAAIVTSLCIVRFPPAPLTQPLAATKASLAETISIRLELWSGAIAGIKSAPLTGLGMNVFRERFWSLEPESAHPRLAEAKRIRPGCCGQPDALGGSLDIAHAHNNFLQTAVDIGLPGLTAYVAIWITAGVMLIRIHRRADGPAARSAAIGLLAGLVAYGVFGLTDAIPLGAKAGLAFWLSLGLTAGTYRVVVTPDVTTASSEHSIHTP